MLHLLCTAKQRSPFSCSAPAGPSYHHLHSAVARLLTTRTKLQQTLSEIALMIDSLRPSLF